MQSDCAVTYTLSVYVGSGAFLAVRRTMVNTVMRKSARMAPMMAPATAMAEVLCS